MGDNKQIKNGARDFSQTRSGAAGSGRSTFAAGGLGIQWKNRNGWPRNGEKRERERVGRAVQRREEKNLSVLVVNVLRVWAPCVSPVEYGHGSKEALWALCLPSAVRPTIRLTKSINRSMSVPVSLPCLIQRENSDISHLTIRKPRQWEREREINLPQKKDAGHRERESKEAPFQRHVGDTEALLRAWSRHQTNPAAVLGILLSLHLCLEFISKEETFSQYCSK